MAVMRLFLLKLRIKLILFPEAENFVELNFIKLSLLVIVAFFELLQRASRKHSHANRERLSRNEIKRTLLKTLLDDIKFLRR